jgi:prevent-host-death family protein
MGAVGAAGARAALPELLTRVERGEQVTITRHGRAVAVLVSPKDVRPRTAGDAFDAADRIDVLLSEAAATGVGSVLLVPEVLGKPLRDGSTDEVRMLAAFLARLDLHPLDRAAAGLATALSSRYRLRAADAAHLATAVAAGAARFLTDNRRDFPATISEVQVTYPEDLPVVR